MEERREREKKKKRKRKRRRREAKQKGMDSMIFGMDLYGSLGFLE